MENAAVELRASNILTRIEPNCFENVRNDVDLNIKMMTKNKIMINSNKYPIFYYVIYNTRLGGWTSISTIAFYKNNNDRKIK